jgi:hypothetical protein
MVTFWSWGDSRSVAPSGAECESEASVARNVQRPVDASPRGVCFGTERFVLQFMSYYSGYFDYLLFIGPAVLLGLWAQFRIRVAYSRAQQLAAPLSGAVAGRHILDSAGLTDVQINAHGQFADSTPSPD